MCSRIHNFGNQKQLFLVNDFIASTSAEIRIGVPIPRGIVMKFDKEYEAGGVVYIQVLKDGPLYKMFYKGHPTIYQQSDRYGMLCYAESPDGIHWERKNLGRVVHNGSMDNNIVLKRGMLFQEDTAFLEKYCESLPESKDFPRDQWLSALTNAARKDLDTFTICMDTRPDCPPDERFKAVTPLYLRTSEDPDYMFSKGVMFAYKSSDGIHWERLQDEPVMTPNSYDSMNLTYWDEATQQYWGFIRGYHGDNENLDLHVRDVRWCTSKDYRTWTEPVQIKFDKEMDIPLYTSAAQKCPGAPNYFIAFPTRYINRVDWSSSYDYLPDADMRKERMETQGVREGIAITDLMMMGSRDGKTWHCFDEAFVRPGIQRRGNWVYGDCFVSVPLVETPCEDDPTAPNELSFYTTERIRVDGECWLRRYSIRQDGFASLHAPITPCETVTDPFTFDGSMLSINFSSSAAGWLKFELQDIDGNPISGYTFEDCDEIFGDTLSRPVLWNNKQDVSALSGQVIRMRIVMSDADLYSFCFA